MECGMDINTDPDSTKVALCLENEIYVGKDLDSLIEEVCEATGDSIEIIASMLQRTVQSFETLEETTSLLTSSMVEFKKLVSNGDVYIPNSCAMPEAISPGLRLQLIVAALATDDNQQVHSSPTGGPQHDPDQPSRVRTKKKPSDELPPKFVHPETQALNGGLGPRQQNSSSALDETPQQVEAPRYFAHPAAIANAANSDMNVKDGHRLDPHKVCLYMIVRTNFVQMPEVRPRQSMISVHPFPPQKYIYI